MDNVKEKTLIKVNVKTLSQFIVLSGLAMFVPFFIHLQWLTGPMVNAILIITLFLVGVRSALVLCMVPSLMALSGGLIPLILAPAIPFIMLGNAILVLTVDYFFNNIKNNIRGFVLGVLFGSFLKFSFLFLSISVVADLLIRQELALKIAQLFGFMQLLTALAGGIIAFIVLRIFKRI